TPSQVIDQPLTIFYSRSVPSHIYSPLSTPALSCLSHSVNSRHFHTESYLLDPFLPQELTYPKSIPFNISQPSHSVKLSLPLHPFITTHHPVTLFSGASTIPHPHPFTSKST